MAELNIVREHTLGLAKARRVAFKWAAQAEEEFAMQCEYLEGKHADEVAFVRSGVKGHLTVTKDRFELSAQLGFLLGAFKGSIEAEIVKNLDALLLETTPAKATSETAARKRPVRKV